MLQDLLNNEMMAALTCTVDRIIDDNKSTAKGTAYQKLQLSDASGSAEVTIWQGSGRLVPATHVGQVLNFKLSSKPYKGNLQISGFWVSTGIQPASRPAQATKPAGGHNDTQMQINRSSACHWAALLMDNAAQPGDDPQELASQMLELAEIIYAWIIMKEPKEPAPF